VHELIIAHKCNLNYNSKLKFASCKIKFR